MNLLEKSRKENFRLNLKEANRKPKKKLKIKSDHYLI